MGQRSWPRLSWFRSRVPTSRCAPTACWASATGIAPWGVRSRLWSVGGGRCRPSRGCWTVQSIATARWSAWWGHPVLARAVWCARWRRWLVTAGWEVFTAFCESHTSQVHFHAVARLLRAATGVEGLDGQTARDRVRDGVPDADPEDLLLLHDLLGIADPDVELPKIDPDARRRRLTALVNAVSLARESPAVYVLEDAHWIDEVSESMLADFLSVVPQTPSLVLVTFRPEYEGALARIHGAQTVALAQLSDSETAALVADLLGPDPS